jgi:hypothetical protein
MISPEDIRKKALKLWETGQFLRAYADGQSLFPLEIRFAKPSSSELAERFSEIRNWLERLRSGSKEVLGHGYSVAYEPLNHRRLGKQSLPKQITIPSEEDFLRLIRKEKEFARFEALSKKLLSEQPELKQVISRNPKMVLEYAPQWDRILAVCRYFLSNSRPSIFLRQLDIPGVDTKFIETHKSILIELLNAVLPEQSIDPSVKNLSDHGFERCFGLRYEEALIRFRFLDPKLFLAGLTDLTVPLAEFCGLKLPINRVFITENKINGLSFPDHPESMVIFGLGYGIGSLFEAAWLKNVEISYWGDIDTHGFAILDRLRTAFPQVQSFLMDVDTLHQFKSLWGMEDPSQRFAGTLIHLLSEEQKLFESLRDNIMGECIRLEQERISYGYVCQKLAELILNPEKVL